MCIFALYGHTATVCFSDPTDARDPPTPNLPNGFMTRRARWRAAWRGEARWE